MDLFGSFYSALKAFISEITINGEGELKAIGLGEINAYITKISELSIDLILIADKEDSKMLSKLNFELKNTIIQFKELFEKEQIDRELFEEFNKKINDLIFSYENIIDPSLIIEKRGDILKSIWNQKGELSQKFREELQIIKEKVEQLIVQFEKEQNIIKKLDLCQKIINHSEELQDDITLVEYQKKATSFLDDIHNNKLRLGYYLSKAKESLNFTLDTLSGKSISHGQYRDVYSNLYSFSSKLKNFAEDDIQKKYYELAKKFIEVDKISHQELSQLILEVLNMNNDIESYFSK